MNTPIDIYCERLEPGLWAEPINALTNLAFIVAAFCAYYLARREHAFNLSTGALIGLIAAMGVGSTLFHTVAVTWAMLTDVLPILLYQLVFIFIYTRHIMKLKTVTSLSFLGLFVLMAYGFMQLPTDWLNGSLEYAPAFLFLGGFAIWHARYAGQEKYGLALVTLVFTVSLTFRSIDMAVCENFPLGTHFIWHMLNALVLYLSTRAYLLNSR